jgi:GT2 family glycosyltransferase
VRSGRVTAVAAADDPGADLLRGPTPGTDRSGSVTITAIVVTWNCRQVALDCLASLIANPPTAPWEVVVVDNASTDGTVDAIRSEAPWARVIANATNRGLPAANNQGMLAARGDLFLISNPDVLWRPGAVDALVDVMHRRERAAWVVPRLLYEDGELQTSAGDLPRLVDALVGRQGERVRRQRHPDPTTGLWWDAWAHDEERQIGRGHEAGYLIRRSAAEEVGLQDERYWLDWEGIDWTARFRDARWEIWLCPRAEAVHLGGTSIKQVPYRWVVSSHRGMYRYFASRATPAARPAIAALVGARAGVKLAVIAVGASVYDRSHRGSSNRRRSR